MGKQHDERLQRYFDGELPPDERARFEAELTAEDRERLAALGEMRALVSGALEGEAAELDLWSAIAGQVTAEPATPATPIDAARKKPKATGRKWSERLWGRGLFGTGAGLLVAAAAALLLLMYPRHPNHPTNGCDVESLEVAGAVATVIQVADEPHPGDGETTIIWTEDK